MNIKKIYFLLSVLLISQLVSAQVLRNDGKINVSAGYMVISGNYQNESTGGIVLDGIIKVSGNWTNNVKNTVIESPDGIGEVIFNGTGTQTIGGTSDTTFYFEELTISSGSITQVQAGKGVTAYGACDFSAAPLVLKSDSLDDNRYRAYTATFINNSTVTGNITMELAYGSTGSSVAATGRTFYFSSPIQGATAGMFDVAAGLNLLWYQDEVARQYVKINSNTDGLITTKGYMLRSATSDVFEFTGAPNSAESYSTVSFPARDTAHYYLFGNPYPAVINWDDLTKTLNVRSTIWYRPFNPVSGKMTTDTWNSASQLGTGNNQYAQVDGQIPPMQSVWVQATDNTGAQITVKRANRSHNWGRTPFIKGNVKDEKNHIRLYIYSGNSRDELIFAQSDLAENTFEERDSRKFFTGIASVAEIYTLSPEGSRLVIQSVKPILEADTIAIGLNVGTAGEYKFVAGFEEFSNNQNVFLWDKQTNTKQDLFINPEYAFTSEIVTDVIGSRFALIFIAAPKLVTSADIQVCSPKTVDLTDPSITDGSDDGLTYTYWLDAKATIAHTTPENSGTGVYYIKGEAANGTYKISDSIVVTINENPTIVVNPVAPICEPATIDLTDSLITDGSTEDLTFTYWLDANATSSVSNPESVSTGTYYIKGVAETGCYSISESIDVTVNPIPEIVINNPAPVDSSSTVDLTAPEITAGSTTGLSFTYWLDEIATIPYLTPQYAIAGDYYLLGTNVTTGCFTIAGPVTVSYASPTGIIDELKNQTTIYSVNNLVYINHIKPGTKILVYNVVGSLLYNKLSGSDNEIIVTNYKPGIYIVKVIGDEFVKSQKIYLQ